MNKKLGLTLLFIGTYATLLGGLVWVMHFTANAEMASLCKPYDWVWGVLVAIILVIGTVMSTKGYIFGFIGLGVVLLGLIGDIWLLLFGITQQNYLSPAVLIGTISVIAGFVLTLISHIWKMNKIAKHGNSMLG